MAKEFQLETQFEPTGDQPQAIDLLIQGIEDGLMHHRARPSPPPT
jgi:excinuclease UvrABC helicase subunit UvrB